jgi:hypothetical protein
VDRKPCSKINYSPKNSYQENTPAYFARVSVTKETSAILLTEVTFLKLFL